MSPYRRFRCLADGIHRMRMPKQGIGGKWRNYGFQPLEGSNESVPLYAKGVRTPSGGNLHDCRRVSARGGCSGSSAGPMMKIRKLTSRNLIH